MTSKFDFVVCLIEESNDLDALTIDQLQIGLLVHVQRKKTHVVEEKALKVNDDAFSTGTGLEHARIAGPVICLWMSSSSAKTRNKKDRRGLACCLSDAKVSSFRWKRRSTA